MSKTYFDIMRQHKILLVLPIVVCLTVAVAFALTAKREYISSASLWADTQVPEVSTVGTTGGQSPPSAGEAVLVTQLLATRAFVSAVVADTPLAEKYQSAGPVEGDYMLADVAGSVTVNAAGPQLLSFSVSRTDPEEALAIAQSLLRQYEIARVDQFSGRAEAQLEYDQRMLALAQAAAKNSDNRSTQALVAEAQSEIQTSTLALAEARSLKLNVVDQPQLGTPQSRRKTLLFGAVGGLLAGLTISLGALLLLMARDGAAKSRRSVPPSDPAAGGVSSHAAGFGEQMQPTTAV